MAAPKGNKFAKGGGRPGAGRPSKEEKAFKIALREELERQAKTKIRQIASRYISRATGANGDKVLMHLVDTVLPKAKQEVELSGGVKIVRVNAFNPDE